MNYYEELEQKIKDFIDQEDYSSALKLIEPELSMPYIPEGFEERLNQFKKLCMVELKQEPQSALSFNQISEWLFSLDPVKVESALIALSEVNLRNYLNDIESLLNHHPDTVVTSMILLECINQQIDTEFTFNKFGLDYKVNPIYIEHPVESDGYLEATEIISDLTFKEPSLNELCQQLLVKEVIVALPITYEEQEAEGLAYSVYQLGLKLLNREPEWYNFIVEKNIKEERCPTLFSTL